MIRINLLKSTSRKKSKPAVKVSPVIPVIILLVILLGTGGYFGYKMMPGLLKPKKSIKPAVVVSVPPPVPVHSGPNMIEEVVKEVGEEHDEQRKLNIPYAEMTFLEKVNYEVAYGRTVFQLLSRAIPSGIGLKLLEVDNFLTVYATGIGQTRELISSTFNALKSEHLEILPQPHSYITANGNKGYKFVVTCKTGFGIDHSDSFQPWEHIGTRDDIPFLLKRISDISSANNVRFSRKPSQISAEDVGLYRRYIYNFKGKGDYKNFVSFILGLYNEKIPCAFKRVALKAGDGAVIDIDLEILLTLKE
ncbi:MAG TPA: hypothetical protein VHO70_21765 [Chitinispirillaceae bacterium]|nr:hypothetical protein [Chitinispirillaceae bacterium]